MGDIADLPFLSLVNGLRSGDILLADYISCLEERFEKDERRIKAFVAETGRFDRLRQQAESLVAHYPNPMHRPPLFGVAVGVKDIFHADGFETRAGSKLPADEIRGREARSVALLKEAGALILGKTVTTEFAYFGPGPTRNPHNLEHTPGGSSSGSAASVAAGLCKLALGTQTIGSINRPAAFCGVVGYKPSYDRISRYGVVPLSPSLDHVGILSSDIAGAEVAASVLCPDWQLVVADRKPVLGVPKGPYLERADLQGMNHFNRLCDVLEQAGCEIRWVEAMADFEQISARHQLILAAEAAQVHADWFARYSDRYHEKTIDLIEKGLKISVGDLAEALTGRHRLRSEILSLMDANQLDLWISPPAPGPAPRGLQSTGDPIMNLPWTHCGLPTATIPAGFCENGLPMGLQVTGRWYEDEAMLEWSAQFELIFAEMM